MDEPVAEADTFAHVAASTRLGRYELLGRLAAGGMGEIFLALRGGAAGFEKLCVIKRILPHLADDDRFRAMLISEARIASSMSHANICHVYELEESDRELYVVMEYLEGVTLLQLLCATAERDQRLELGFVAGVIQQACEGLHYAHELRDRSGIPLGVVHRDVTQSNLFVTDSGVLKIVDFGVAKVQDVNESRSGAAKGKYGYMAPEQVRGRPVDRRADVFSVGELLTTRRLYQRTTDYLTLRAMMAPPDLQLSQHRPDAPAALEPVLLRALAKNPEDRYPTVRQLEAALLGALGDVRPWGQAEISELFCGLFADRVRLTNVEISRVRELARRGFDRPISTMLPHSAQDDELEELDIELREDTSGADDIDPFSEPDARAAHTDERNASLPRALSQQQPERRSAAGWAGRFLPVVAIVGAAAVALGTGLAVIGRREARRDPVAMRAPSNAAPRGAATSHRPTEPYGIALGAHASELDQCARVHREPLAAYARAMLVVGTDGRTRKVTLDAAGSRETELGSCIRAVLGRVVFPHALEDKEIVVGLAVLR